jgi:hypothetical protein
MERKTLSTPESRTNAKEMLPKPNEPRLKLIPPMIMLLCSVTSKEQWATQIAAALGVSI